MLRFCYSLLDILATAFALLSPVAIMHWLLTSIGAQLPGMEFFAAFFGPFNGLVDFILHPPPIHFEEQTVQTAQGIVGILFTALFFVCNMGSQTLKAAEQKVNVTKEAISHRHRLEKLKQEKQRMEKRITTNKKLVVSLFYDFSVNPNAAAQFETKLSGTGSKLLQTTTSGLVAEFHTVEGALNYCWQSSQSVLQYYATLRPMDPQPPFQIGIHAIEADEPGKNAVPKLDQLVRYAGPNFIVITHHVQSMIEAEGLTLKWRTQSMGMYSFELEKSQEVFRLLGKKTD